MTNIIPKHNTLLILLILTHLPQIQPTEQPTNQNTPPTTSTTQTRYSQTQEHLDMHLTHLQTILTTSPSELTLSQMPGITKEPSLVYSSDEEDNNNHDTNTTTQTHDFSRKRAYDLKIHLVKQETLEQQKKLSHLTNKKIKLEKHITTKSLSQNNQPQTCCQTTKTQQTPKTYPPTTQHKKTTHDPHIPSTEHLTQRLINKLSNKKTQTTSQETNNHNNTIYEQTNNLKKENNYKNKQTVQPLYNLQCQINDLEQTNQKYQNKIQNLQTQIIQLQEKNNQLDTTKNSLLVHGITIQNLKADIMHLLQQKQQTQHPNPSSTSIPHLLTTLLFGILAVRLIIHQPKKTELKHEKHLKKP